jgi:hypothetical protein
MASIQAVNSKFDWARHHFQLYHAEMTQYMQINPCKFVPKPNVTTDQDGRSWVMGTFECAIPIPEQLPLIVGDCLGNLRSTLDYLVWELVLANGKKPGINNAFPIAQTPDAYAKEINNGRLRGVCSAACAVIETLQPYHARNDADKSLLSVLNKFTNVNKHRRIFSRA